MRLDEADDDALETVASWFDSAHDVYLFAGDSAAWPLTGRGLRRDLEPGENRPAGRAFVAELDGVVVAHVVLRGVGTERVHLTRVAVAPSARGRRLRTPFVEAAVALAESAGSSHQTMYVVPGNEPALRAYRRCGFVDSGVDPAHPEYVFLQRFSAAPPRLAVC